MYIYAAQYDFPPNYPVSVICKGIDGAAYGADTLSRIYGGLVAYEGSGTCKINDFKSTPKPSGSSGNVARFDGWEWQVTSFFLISLYFHHYIIFKE